MQYSEKVLDHFTHPRNVGEIEDANGVGEVGNAKCGDIMKIYLKVSDDGIIEDVKFKTFGCGAAIATSSMATEMVKGKSLEEALKLTNKAVAEALDGLPPVKMHCSVLAEEALRSAISASSSTVYSSSRITTPNRSRSGEEICPARVVAPISVNFGKSSRILRAEGPFPMIISTA